jgi:hypothetical protein
MKRQPGYLLALMLLCTISSCKKTVVDSSFDENIRIRMTETVDSTKRVLNLVCATEKIFACSNYGILTTYSLTNDKITIYFNKIITPDICLTSLGPASTVINLSGLPNKTYELELNFGSAKISGQLAITEGSFIATLPTQTKVQFLNPDLKRIPANTIYGTVHYHSASTSSIAQQFIDSLQLYGATSALYPAGDYIRFQIEANGQIRQTQDPGYYFTRYYIFNYSASSGQLKDLVKRFGTSYPNLLLVSLYTTKGETFYSWTK